MGRSDDELGTSDWLGRVISGLEAGILTLLFLALVGLGLTQIGMRNMAGMALPWADGAMRALVLWLTMVGAVVGAGRLKHIRIDLIDHILPPLALLWLRRLVFLATSAICLTMTWYSLQIVALEYEFRQTAFLDVPVWLVQVIIPIGFAIMGARFAAWGMVPPRGTISPGTELGRDA